MRVASLTWYPAEHLDTLVNRLVRLRHVLVNLLGVDVDQWVVHPTLMPSQPVARRDPQQSERLKVLQQLAHLLKLHIPTNMADQTGTIQYSTVQQWFNVKKGKGPEATNPLTPTVAVRVYSYSYKADRAL